MTKPVKKISLEDLTSQPASTDPDREVALMVSYGGEEPLTSFFFTRYRDAKAILIEMSLGLGTPKYVRGGRWILVPSLEDPDSTGGIFQVNENLVIVKIVENPSESFAMVDD